MRIRPRIFRVLLPCVFIPITAGAVEFRRDWPFPPAGKGPAVGVNLGWQPHRYGSDLTGELDRKYWEERFSMMREAGLRVARIWLFENGEGIEMRSPLGGITGLKEDFVRNVRTLAGVARKHGILVYWTLLNGNTSRERDFFRVQYNIQNGRYGEQERFFRRVVHPLGRELSAFTNNFAVDIINEAEAAFFEGSASGRRAMRRFLGLAAAHLHVSLPGVPVTASGGWHVSWFTHAMGFFRGLGLDFYDIHVYHYAGEIMPGCRAIIASLDAPVLLGEFGIPNDWLGPASIRHAYASLFRGAARCGFAGALAWRLDDPYKPHHSLLTADGRNWRPWSLPLLRLMNMAR